MNEYFIQRLFLYVTAMEAHDVNISSINSPRAYKKLYGSGGAAEEVRGLFAYQLAVLDMIRLSNPAVFSPFVVDTPNQQDQKITNYSKIIESLINSSGDDSQVILCAMPSSALDIYSILASNTISLSKTKLLRQENYTALNELFSKLIISTDENSNKNFN